MNPILKESKEKKMQINQDSLPVKSAPNRRQFLMSVLSTTGQVAIASGVIYSFSLVTSKNGNTAGAK